MYRIKHSFYGDCNLPPAHLPSDCVHDSRIIQDSGIKFWWRANDPGKMFFASQVPKIWLRYKQHSSNSEPSCSSATSVTSSANEAEAIPAGRYAPYTAAATACYCAIPVPTSHGLGVWESICRLPSGNKLLRELSEVIDT